MSHHSAVTHILQFFVYEHLPSPLRPVSKPFSVLADVIAAGSSNPETTVALRKLLEARDAAVRASVAEFNKPVPGHAGRPIPPEEQGREGDDRPVTPHASIDAASSKKLGWKVTGNTDMWELLCKAVNQDTGEYHSTKILRLTEGVCIIQCDSVDRLGRLVRTSNVTRIPEGM